MRISLGGELKQAIEFPLPSRGEGFSRHCFCILLKLMCISLGGELKQAIEFPLP